MRFPHPGCSQLQRPTYFYIDWRRGRSRMRSCIREYMDTCVDCPLWHDVYTDADD